MLNLEDDFDPRLQTLLDLRSSLDAAIRAMVELPKMTEEMLYWRRKYNEELNQSIRQSEKMAANMLMLAIRGGRKGA